MSRKFANIISRGKKTLSIIRNNVPKMNQFDVGMSIPSDLKGRDLITFKNYRTQDIYSLLWIAHDLKQRESFVKACEGKTMSIISDNLVRKISLSSAGLKLGVAMTFISPKDINHENMDLEMLGKTVGSACDIVVFDSTDFDHKSVQEFATGCTVPVVCIESSHLCPIYCLSELLTIFEHYGYLRRLVISFVGGKSSDPLLNTYAILLPKVGMHLNYFVDGNMDFDIWQQGIELATEYNTEFKQFDTLYDATYRSHIISSALGTMDLPQITIKDTKEMDLDWTILSKDAHYKSYTQSFFSNELLRCQQCLIWKNILNMQWILMATLLATTTTSVYSPTINRPQFEGQP